MVKANESTAGHLFNLYFFTTEDYAVFPKRANTRCTAIRNNPYSPEAVFDAPKRGQPVAVISLTQSAAAIRSTS